jgi:hypothetical protein
MRRARTELSAILVCARDLVRVAVGYAAYRRTGSTSRDAELGLRGLFTFHPRLPWALAALVGRRRRHGPSRPVEGVLGRLDSGTAVSVADALMRDGIHRFTARVSEATVLGLRRFAGTTPSFARLESGSERVPLSFGSPVAACYDFDEDVLLRDGRVQRLVADPSIAAVARAYLGETALFARAAMWWSIPFGDEPSSTAAQLFHSDRDYTAFVKFFVYLTDVSPRSGPHVYVRTSHRRRPRRLRRDVRFDDLQVASEYAGRIEDVCGPAGTVFVADTSGLHKGVPPADEPRLVFQLEFASSLFGTNAPRNGG